MDEDGKELLIEKKYTDSLFYEVFLTGKYIKKMGEQLFKHLGIDFTSEEFSALDLLYKTENICQRDLAVKMLINRANMGKILNSLEKKECITRKVSTKCNHPVKFVALTEKGTETYIKTVNKLRERCSRAIDEITEEEADIMLEGLKKMRKVLKETLDIDI